MVTVKRKREAVILLKTKTVSERRSYELLFISRSTCRYQLKREPDPEFEKTVKELAIEHPRFGYRRVHALLLRRGGLTVIANVSSVFGRSSGCQYRQERGKRNEQENAARNLCQRLLARMKSGHTTLYLTAMRRAES